MVIRINNKRGITIGFLFDTVYISCESLNLLSCAPVSPKSQRLGKEYKDYCRIGNMCYKNLEFLINDGMIEFVLNTLRNNGLLFRNVIFFKVKKDFIQGYPLSRNWEQKFKGVDLYYCCDSFGNGLGFLALKKNYIVMVEVLDKGIGFGTYIINSMLDIKGCLKGMSVVDAKRFWLKQGADFSPDGLYFSIKN